MEDCEEKLPCRSRCEKYNSTINIDERTARLIAMMERCLVGEECSARGKGAMAGA
jgi:hypothetical protein